MAILNKTELYAAIVALFPTTGAQFITAASLRAFLDDFVASNLINEPVTITTPNAVIIADIDVIIADAGASVITLPSITAYKYRAIKIINISGGAVTIQGNIPDTISGNADIKLFNNSVTEFSANVSTGNWVKTSQNRQDIDVNFYDENNGNSTTISTASTYTNADVDLKANNVNALFSVSGNQVTYLGGVDINVKIAWACAVECQTPERLFGGKVFKNFGLGSEVILNGRMIGVVSSDNPRMYTLFTYVTLSQGDILHFNIANLENNNNLTVTDQTIQISEIRG